MIPIILTVGVLTILYYLLHLNYQYWSKRGVPGPKPHFIVGNTGKTLIFKESAGQVFTEIYNKYKNEDIVGVYRATTPVLLIRDPELIKEMTTKSFSNFHDNDFEVLKNIDPIIGRHPFALRGEEWKVVRQQLTPGFTSGKQKLMYPLLEEVCRNLVKYIDRQPEMSSGEGYDAKNVCARYTLNNVASCAFGIEGKCLEEKNSQFQQLVFEFFSPGSATILGFYLMTVFPSLTKALSIRMVTKGVEKKITDLVMQTVKYREDNNVERNDYLNILMNLRKTSNYKFENIDIVAHAAGFLGDGYETSATIMSFVLFELASNSEIQEKVRSEVTKAFENNDNKLPYDVLQELQYLEAVIYETLRLHPPTLHLQKVCTKQFTFTSKSAKKLITIEKDTPIILPVYGLQRDPKYYEDPDIFKPERFLFENKEKLVKYTFLAFGEGPRSCLGQRFGMLQLKLGLAHILHNYEIALNKKTQVPIKYETTNPLTSPVGGIWLNFKRIN